MKHYRNLITESQTLTVFEMLNKLQDFLHEKHGIKAFGAKEDNGFVMYMSNYVTDEEGLHDKDLSESIQKFVEKEFSELKPVVVHKDNYGYHIEFGENKQAAKLVEVTQAQGTGMSDSKVSYKCHFCGKMDEGYGNDPWPLDTNPTHRVCDKCNDETVIPARIERLTKKETKTENVDQRDVEASASNAVLDDKYTWLFSVLDENGQDIAEGLEYLKDAIDVLVKEDAAFLVAFPYVDPKPGDPDVEFVFADNPGPVIIYNNEEATFDKADVERPTSETQPKDEIDEEEVEEEETVEEAFSEERIKREIEDLKDKNNEIRKGRMTGSIHRNNKRIKELENQLRDMRTESLDENVHADITEEKLEIYLMNAVDMIQEMSGLDKVTIEQDVIGTRGNLKIQLLNAMEYLQEISGMRMSEIEKEIGCPMNTYINLATDNSELKTEALDDDMEDESYKVIATLNANWYNYLEDSGVDMDDAREVLDNESAVADRVEELLHNADIMVSFGAPYFLSDHDLETSECSLENSRRAVEIIEDFMGDWVDTQIISLEQ